MTEEQIKGRIYLTVIIPLLEEVVKQSKTKQEAIKNWNCVVQFGVKGENFSVHLCFEGGNLKIIKGAHPSPTISLVFPTISALIDNFSGKKPSLSTRPKIRGWWHIILLMKVLKLLKSLSILIPSYEPPDIEGKKLKVTLLLYTVVYSLEILSLEDEFVRNVIAGATNKIVQWSVLPDGPHIWAEVDKSGVKAEKGTVKRPYISMEFKDVDAAYSLLTEKVGTLEALVQGLLTIKGVVEYSIKVGSMMQRVGEYLKPKE